jgi:hypothetical protein
MFIWAILKKNQVLPDILRKNFDHVVHFSIHQVLKNSLHGQISNNFDVVSLKMLETLYILTKDECKTSTRHTREKRNFLRNHFSYEWFVHPTQ